MVSELLTVVEVARLTKLSAVTIRHHIRGGRLRAVKIDGCVRVPREAVDALLTPMEPPVPEKSSQAQTVEEYLGDIVGILTNGPSHISENKHKYLAEAYLDNHRSTGSRTVSNSAESEP